MSNERINEHSIEAKIKTIWDETGNKDFPPMNRHLAYGLVLQELLTELKRCYYDIDLLQEYAKCVECGGRYIGPMDYGLDKHDHSEDCEYRLTE